jgi:hypothetical protein
MATTPAGKKQKRRVEVKLEGGGWVEPNAAQREESRPTVRRPFPRGKAHLDALAVTVHYRQRS